MYNLKYPLSYRSARPPKQMEWCGADAVLCYWETDKDHLLFMIGPKSKWLRYVRLMGSTLTPLDIDMITLYI